MIWRIESHSCQELLEYNGYLFEALVVLYIVLDELAARQPLVVLVFEAARNHRKLVIKVIVLL
jgi:hypothetical protein